MSNLVRFGIFLIAILCLGALAVPYLAQQGIGLPGLPAQPTVVVPTETMTLEPTSSIPTRTPEPSPTIGPTPTATPRAGFEYTVVEGDSLYSIALANELTIEQLVAANGKTSDSLSIGEVLIIPPPDYQIPTATPFPPNLQPGTEL
ncbi:MAG: LysM peptidoglycan-binding domain-containing protein, partial [Dehalococcoidia bacterium]|nr:LysM peptidoglycan-binding domain-containing protein [Dehalococcoidia bacterium]